MGKDDVSKMLDIIAGTLSGQKYFIAGNSELLPEKAKDNWSLGYIGGYSDAIMQRKGIDTDASGFAIMNIVFMVVFGEEEGPVYFRKFMDLQQSRDLEVLNGMKKGGDEMYAWLSDSDNLPMGWAGHVRSTA